MLHIVWQIDDWQIQVMPVTIFLVIFDVHVNILVIIKVKILVLINS